MAGFHRDVMQSPDSPPRDIRKLAAGLGDEIADGLHQDTIFNEPKVYSPLPEWRVPLTAQNFYKAMCEVYPAGSVARENLDDWYNYYSISICSANLQVSIMANNLGQDITANGLPEDWGGWDAIEKFIGMTREELGAEKKSEADN